MFNPFFPLLLFFFFYFLSLHTTLNNRNKPLLIDEGNDGLQDSSQMAIFLDGAITFINFLHSPTPYPFSYHDGNCNI
ncbi:hypothetical protein BDC45DRAFT_508156 [Circinella umbellata]|nr:hypothetical protein BDC45DRAFT_508156 [Circinella umbellata]